MSKSELREQLKSKDFKVRSSSANGIMAEIKEFTENHAKKLKELQDKQDLYKEKGKDLAKTDTEAMNSLLILQKSKPELPEGAKTLVEKWVKENVIYRRRRLVGSKYTKKGNDNEDAGVELFASYMGLGEIFRYDGEEKSNDFLTGTPDIILKNCIVDIKNSYTFDTFPVFDTKLSNKNYWAQMQSYMELFDKEFALVVYVLTDADEAMIEREARSQAWILGLEEVTKELYDSVRLTMTYEDVDPRLKVRIFRVDRDRNYIQRVRKRVEMCRDYASQLIDDFKASIKEQKNLINL